MMMVETELRQSGIHGIGVFLRHAVKKGQVIWRFDSRIDRVYTDAEVATLPDFVQSFLHTYSTFHDETALWVLCGDNGRYFNHAEAPNTISEGIAFGQDFAADDLPSGTELTSDYRTICDHIRRLGAPF